MLESDNVLEMIWKAAAEYFIIEQDQSYWSFSILIEIIEHSVGLASEDEKE